MVAHGNDYYYCYGNGVGVNKLSSLSKINKRNSAIVYQAPAGTDYSYDDWAPELHYINGEWYIYVAADNGYNSSHPNQVSGSGRDGRSVRISPVTFDENGKPDFGNHPVPEVTFPVPVK